MNFKAKNCIMCGKSFIPHNGKHIACDEKCQLLNRKTHMNKWTKTYRDKLRRIIIKGYGGKCVCCSESNIEFLALDHVNNDGASHRRQLFGVAQGQTSRPVQLCNWILRNNFPNSIQILCHNCNNAKSYYGECPHRREALYASGSA